MRKQLHDWKVLVDAIFDKIAEFIDGQNGWDSDANLWVDLESNSVSLAEAGKVLRGESLPAIKFVTANDTGDLEPDGDLIEEYAYQWFDFRTGD